MEHSISQHVSRRWSLPTEGTVQKDNKWILMWSSERLCEGLRQYQSTPQATVLKNSIPCVASVVGRAVLPSLV